MASDWTLRLIKPFQSHNFLSFYRHSKISSADLPGCLNLYVRMLLKVQLWKARRSKYNGFFHSIQWVPPTKQHPTFSSSRSTHAVQTENREKIVDLCLVCRHKAQAFQIWSRVAQQPYVIFNYIRNFVREYWCLLSWFRHRWRGGKIWRWFTNCRSGLSCTTHVSASELLCRSKFWKAFRKLLLDCLEVVRRTF